jgi:hypothetical protein
LRSQEPRGSELPLRGIETRPGVDSEIRGGSARSEQHLGAAASALAGCAGEADDMNDMWGASLARMPAPLRWPRVPREESLRINGLLLLSRLGEEEAGSDAPDVRSLVQPGSLGWSRWIASAWLREPPRRAVGSPASEQVSDNSRGK